MGEQVDQGATPNLERDKSETRHQADQERLAADRDRLAQLKACNFAGRPWVDLQNDLATYARRRLPAKICYGEIFRMMRDLDIPPARDLQLPEGGVSREDARDLSHDVIAIALPRFNRILAAGGWDGDRQHAATLRTYFMSQCAIQFRAPWRRWLTNVYPTRRTELATDSDLIFDRSDEFAYPERVATNRFDINRALKHLPRDLQTILVLDAFGWPDAAIAARVGISPKAVEYRLKRARVLIKTIGDDNESAA